MSLRAQVVINEFMADLPSGQSEELDEWVELYNQGNTEVDLNGWVLTDDNRQHARIIYNQRINPNEYLIITRNGSDFSLNNSGDSLSLYDSTQSAQLDLAPIDKFSYNSSVEGRTWGRIPDGTGEFVASLQASKGTANIPNPTTTPTPLATSKPTPSPKIQNSESSKTSPSSEVKEVPMSAKPTNDVVSKTTHELEEISEVETDFIGPRLDLKATRSASVAGIIDLNSDTATASSESRRFKKRTKASPAGLYLFTAGAFATTAGLSPMLIRYLRELKE